MIGISGRGAASGLVLIAVIWMTGCGSYGNNRAPVEDRGAAVSVPAPAPAPTPAPATAATTVDLGASAPRQPAGSDNAGKLGYYTVKPGDTLIRIGLDNGQNWKDIARWNNLENPNLVEVGQVLRVAPPVLTTATAAVVTRPVAPAAITTIAVAPAQSASAATPAAAGVASSPATNTDDDVTWVWPARGSVLNVFDEAKNKGLDIGGAAGDPVLAAADGRVVYVGASLRGYGNLIILKHNNTYLTAYAHNQALLVKEDQTVRKGQKIAEMGNSDADRVKLHFEVRRQGKPVDPVKYLPQR